ncbi:hypothetical protein MTR67_023316 [Solanum verrucosum]|uniref:Uncharacterized protein n=1 Tax=Solanum verrucosum TaxID=315347 RepID=A0AAF0TRQ5_SOLVR|nr:hypothetical protein MTR67_023316 [Solanum verrucosum]
MDRGWVDGTYWLARGSLLELGRSKEVKTRPTISPMFSRHYNAVPPASPVSLAPEEARDAGPPVPIVPLAETGE